MDASRHDAWDEIERRVTARASHRCEYCGMHQSLQGATFRVEHIVPRSKGSATTLENPALACPSCNLRKSDRIEVEDPETQTIVRFLNPRVDRWDEHLSWDGYELVAQTIISRALIAALTLNSPRRIRIRHAEEMFDLFPPLR